MSTVDSSPADELVLTGWSVLSAYGVGTAPFAEGIAAGRSAVAEAPADGPYEQMGLIPGFSIAGQLGRKGTRTMDRVTAIAVTAFSELIESCGEDLTRETEQVGIVLGTGSGSVQSIMDFTRDSLTGEKPYHVEPARFPNTVMNRAAGQSAIWHRIKGPNTTIAGGWLTGLLALSYAVRLHRGGHCAHVLWGSVEECSEQRSWLEWHGRGESGEPLGEGGAAFLLESRGDAEAAGRTPLARVLTTRFAAFDEPAQARDAVAKCITGALKQAEVDAKDIALVAPHDGDGELGAAERAGIADALGPDAAPQWVPCRRLVGDASAAATSLQLAAVIALADHTDKLALVTGVDAGGMAGCALVSLDAR
jgi:3-oxoacyl-[acyl-carrier-protein] synthase II